jgi:hypothetical protein
MRFTTDKLKKRMNGKRKAIEKSERPNFIRGGGPSPSSMLSVKEAMARLMPAAMMSKVKQSKGLAELSKSRDLKKQFAQQQAGR